MRSSRFTDAQKAFVVKQGEDGVPVAEVCRKAGISQATYFNWKKKYAGLMPSEMKRLREFDYVVVNRRDLLEDAVADVESIIRCEHCRTLPRKVVL